MRGDDINQCEKPSDCFLSEDVKAQLEQLNQAQHLMQYIIAGIFLRYQLFNVQRDQLLASVCLPECPSSFPDTFQMETTSSLLILYALCGYFAQNQQFVAQAESGSAARCSLEQDGLLSAIVILVGILRFFKLLDRPEEHPAEQSSEEEALELDVI